jgi:methylamine dehydrogenase heavy chain
MRTWKLASALLAAGWLLSPLNFAAAQEPLKPEEVTTATIPAGTPKLFVIDLAFGHIVDGRVHVLNADTLEYLGVIGSAFLGQVYVPEGKDELYISTTYLERLSRGKRTDVLETYDTSTLSAKGEEIRLADTRAMAVNYRPMMHGSADGRWMFVQNASPATSISVVDMKKGSQTAEIQNAGCYGIYPVAGNSLKFATMCGDGTFGLYVMNEDGTAAERKASEKIFDADTDALFIHGDRAGNDWLFVSFKGDLYRVNFDGDTARLVEKSTIATEGWRPSAYQTHDYVPTTGTIFVLMHPKGAEGSHKNPAEEIWAYDVKGKRLLSRSPTKTAFAIVASDAASPVVYAINLVESKVHRYTTDPANGFRLTAAGEVKAGETPCQIELQ